MHYAHEGAVLSVDLEEMDMSAPKMIKTLASRRNIFLLEIAELLQFFL